MARKQPAGQRDWARPKLFNGIKYNIVLALSVWVYLDERPSGVVVLPDLSSQRAARQGSSDPVVVLCALVVLGSRGVQRPADEGRH